jgi:hypothetical protein
MITGALAVLAAVIAAQIARGQLKEQRRQYSWTGLQNFVRLARRSRSR